MPDTMPLPTHPDFSRLLQVMSEGDDKAFLMSSPTNEEEAHAALAEFYDGLVDEESINAAIHARVLMVMQEIHPLQFLADPVSVLSALYADAFLIGVRFATNR